MSAGTGILHSEKNDSWRVAGPGQDDAVHTDPVHFVQMWVVPDETGITPGYEQLEIDHELFAVGMFAGRLAVRLGGKTLVTGGCLIGAAAIALLAFAHHQQWEIYVSNALMGIGFGFAFSAMSALIVMAVPASQTGVASGMNANIRTIGGSIGSAAMASIVTSRLASSGLPLESGYTTGFAVMTGALVLAAAAGLLIPAARRLRQQDGAAGPEQAELALAGESE
jgi:MFS family permease